jgi:hypothetical protein
MITKVDREAAAAAALMIMGNWLLVRPDSHDHPALAEIRAGVMS